MSYYIYGVNSINTIISCAPERIITIEATKKASEKLSSRKSLSIVDIQKINKIFPEENHQGVIAKIKEKANQGLDKLVSKAANDQIIILDRITDVGNVGAIIRSAVAFGITKIIIPKHDSQKDPAKLAKASAGYSEICEICEVANLSKTLEILKNNNYWCIGLDGAAKDDISILKQYEKLALILGSEGKGIKDLVKKHCDLLVKIPMNNNVESLNVAAAAAISFFSLK